MLFEPVEFSDDAFSSLSPAKFLCTLLLDDEILALDLMGIWFFSSSKVCALRKRQRCGAAPGVAADVPSSMALLLRCFVSTAGCAPTQTNGHGQAPTSSWMQHSRQADTRTNTYTNSSLEHPHGSSQGVALDVRTAL